MIDPVLSPKPIERLHGQEVTLELDPQTGHAVLTWQNAEYEHITYVIDTTEWVVRMIDINRPYAYNALFIYETHDELPVLTRIAFQGDSSLEKGGIALRDIAISHPGGSLAAHPVARGQTPDAAVRVVVNNGKLMLTLPQAAGAARYRIQDLSGRVLHEGVIPAEQQVTAWNGLSDSGLPVVNGHYVVTWETEFGRGARVVGWMR